MGQFWEPISRLGQFYTQLLVAMASSERIFEFLDTRPDVADRPEAREMAPIRGHVRFERVGFAYEPGRPVLHDIDFEVEPGQTIALVGHTGSGKTTITALLSRFYDPVEGRILIDGVDIRTVRLASLRSQMAVVLQDTFLFQGTVADNIRYGRLDATDAEVEAAARAACAHDFIIAMENGYDTEVRERGSPSQRRPAAADLLRPRLPGRPADPDPRRGHLAHRHPDRDAHSGGAASGSSGAHGLRRGSPPVDHPQCRPHPGARPRPHRRVRAPTTSCMPAGACTTVCFRPSTATWRPRPGIDAGGRVKRGTGAVGPRKG